MFVLLLILLVVFVILAVVLAAGTLGIQGYIYSEPVGDVVWRGPVAAFGITFFLAVWALLNYAMVDPTQSDLPLETLFRFNPTEVREVDKFVSVRAPVVIVGEPEQNTQKITYTRRETGGQGPADYVDAGGKRWERSDASGMMVAILVDDKGKERRFEPKLVEAPNPTDPKGPKVKVFPSGGEAFPGYYEKGGRGTMYQLGVISLFRWGLFLFNLFFNALFLGVWFVCVWLILRFQWTHALALAVLLWLVSSLVVVPMLLSKTGAVARSKGTAPRAALIDTTKSS